jgi:serine protease Do
MARAWAVAALAALLLSPVAEAKKRRTAETYWTEARAQKVREERSVLSEVARGAMPAVVSITTVQPAAPGEKEEQTGLGTGFIIHPDGYILTSAHVIEAARAIRVALLGADGFTEEYDAELVGEDKPTDFALLKIDASRKLPVLPLGRSTELDIADWVVVIGNPFGLGHSVSVGVVSFKGRTDVVPNGLEGYFDYIQTDAAINPGNSGGPVLDLNGNVVAIANAVNVSGQGIAFAIPIEVAKTIIPHLRKEGRVRRGWAGISIQDITPDSAEELGLSRQRGVLISEVYDEGPAARAGLQPGDVIVGVDDVKTLRSQALRWRVSNKGAGGRVRLNVERGGRPLHVDVTLDETPEVAAVAPPPAVGGSGEEGAGADPESRGSATSLDIGARVTPVGEADAHVAGLSHPFGALVTEVDPSGVGHSAGLRAGDVVVKVNKEEVASLPELKAALDAVPSGEWVRLFVRRSSETHALTLRKP